MIDLGRTILDLLLLACRDFIQVTPNILKVVTGQSVIRNALDGEVQGVALVDECRPLRSGRLVARVDMVDGVRSGRPGAIGWSQRVSPRIHKEGFSFGRLILSLYSTHVIERSLS